MTHTTHRFVPAIAAILSLGIGGTLAAAENMIGPQSHNEGMVAVPTTGAVTIDGDLTEWDRSGRIWIIPHETVKGQFSVQTAAMWDADNLYLGIEWKDPTPINSTIDPDHNAQDGWKADCAQLNISTDRSMWVLLWNYSTDDQPCMRQTIWADLATYRKGQDTTLRVAEPGGTDLGDGVEMAYKVNESGDGYVQEVKLPWAVLYAEVPEIAAGLEFRMGQEYLWADPTGNTWPILRYADNMAPGVTSREFFWAGSKPWGKVTLVGENEVETRRYVSGDGTMQGTIPIRAELPEQVARFTLVIEDQEGNRVRNLAGDFDPQAYEVAVEDGTRIVEVLWDGLDDDGALVAPGSYRVRGLHHKGLDARYEMCFYNPGTPPWKTTDGSGAWGADHSAPYRVTRAGEWMIISWKFAEGGHGIIGLDPDGKKRWGEKRGALTIAADAEYLYAQPKGWHIKGGALIRMTVADGSYAAFVKDGEERPFELPFSEIFGGEDAIPGELVDIEVHGDVLALSFDGGVIALLDKASAELLKRIEVADPGPLAYTPDGALYALLGGKPHAIDVEAGTASALPIDGFAHATDLASDLHGHLLVADMGPDKQVKAYATDGTLVYAVGRQGGRALVGAYDAMGMHAVSSVDVDARGRIWTTEHDNLPRRVVVWGADSALIHEYLGNSEYAGTGAFLHETRPNLGYFGPMEFQLDRSTRTARLSRVLWNPDEDAGEAFAISPSDHANGTRFTRVVDGVAREYLFDIPYRLEKGYVLYMERHDRWRPVAAVTTVGRVLDVLDGKMKLKEGATLEGVWAGCHYKDGVFWNDGNGDGKVQFAECEIVDARIPLNRKGEPVEKKARPGLVLGSGWGGRMDEDFVFYASGRSEDPLVRYAPIGFSPDGAPRYGSAGMSEMAFDGGGTLVPVADEDRLLVMPQSGEGTIRSWNPETGALQWRYPSPYPGVHGSHRALMPAPGLIIGPLKIMGTAHANDDAGKVFAMRGNLGQDFFMTTDGLYVGSLFQDTRMPTLSLPGKEAQLVGMPMSPFSEGGEPFNGWFGKQSDGKIRMTTGMARQGSMVLEILGLKSIRRFALEDISVDAEILAQADADNVARAAAEAKEKVLVAKRIPADANKPDWKLIDPVEIERPGQPMTGVLRVAYDESMLYLQYVIKDASPWRNLGKNYAELFKTGDAVDLKLCIDPELAGDDKRRKVGASDVRVLIAQLDGKPVAVLMKPIDESAPDEVGYVYHSPVTDKHFDRVEVIEAATVRKGNRSDGYRIDAAIPFAALGFTPSEGLVLRGDVGFILSDEAGETNTARVYWANKDTNLVNDMPFESWMAPQRWGQIRFE